MSFHYTEWNDFWKANIDKKMVTNVISNANSNFQTFYNPDLLVLNLIAMVIQSMITCSLSNLKYDGNKI